MKIKKLILIILMLSLILSTFATVNVSADEDINLEELMIYLGVAQKDEGVYTVSRAKFVKSLATVCGFNSLSSASAADVFSDIDGTEDYANAFGIFYDYKVISGYEDGLAHPLDNIEVAQAIKMIVSMLGLDYRANVSGGYPTGYFVEAQKRGLMKNITYDDAYLTSTQMYNLLYNLMYVKQNYASEFDGDYKQGDELFMEKMLSLSEGEGVVTDDGNFSLYGETNTKEGQIKIDGVVYDNPYKFACELGVKYKFIYKYDGPNSTDRAIVYMYIPDDNTISFDNDDIKQYSNYTYTCDVNEKEKAYKLDREFKLIYNFVPVTDGTLYSDALLIPSAGKVTLIDNNNDEKYDVVRVEEYQTTVVDTTNSDTKIVYGVKGYGTKANITNDMTSAEIIAETNRAKSEIKSYDLNDENDNKVDICDDAGNSLTFSDIQQRNTVLTIYESVCGKYVKVVKSVKHLPMKIDEVFDDGKCLVSDTEYEYTNEFSDYIDKYNISIVGTSYEYYFDSFGDLAYVSASSYTDDKLGYLISIKQERGLSQVVSAKIFCDNEIKTYEISEKCTIDGVKCKTNNDVATYLNIINANKNSKLFMFEQNKDEEICLIDTAKTNVSDTQSLINFCGSEDGNTGFSYSNNLKAFYNGKKFIYYSDNAKFFIISDPYVDGEILQLTPTEYLKNINEAKNLNFYAYKYNTEDFVSDVIVGYSPAVGLSVASLPLSKEILINSFAVVENISSALNSNGDNVYKLTLKRSAESVTMYTAIDSSLKFGNSGNYNEDLSMQPYTVSEGDIIAFGTNSKGEITDNNFYVLYDCDREVAYEPLPFGGSYYGNDYFCRYVYAYKKIGSLIAFTAKDPTVETINENTDLFVFDMNEGSILLHDSVKKSSKAPNLININTSDIITYTENNAEFDKGMFRTTSLSKTNAVLAIYR